MRHIFKNGIISDISFHLFSTQNYVSFTHIDTHSSAMSSPLTLPDVFFLFVPKTSFTACYYEPGANQGSYFAFVCMSLSLFFFK